MASKAKQEPANDVAGEGSGGAGDTRNTEYIGFASNLLRSSNIKCVPYILFTIFLCVISVTIPCSYRPMHHICAFFDAPPLCHTQWNLCSKDTLKPQLIVS